MQYCLQKHNFKHRQLHKFFHAAFLQNQITAPGVTQFAFVVTNVDRNYSFFKDLVCSFFSRNQSFIYKYALFICSNIETNKNELNFLWTSPYLGQLEKFMETQ